MEWTRDQEGERGGEVSRVREGDTCSSSRRPDPEQKHTQADSTELYSPLAATNEKFSLL